MSNRPTIPAEITREILLESGHRCAVCGTPCPLERAHIIPWHKSREHKVEDLICLCANCHERADKEKWGEKTLREYKRRPWVLRQHDGNVDQFAGQPPVDFVIVTALEEERDAVLDKLPGYQRLVPSEDDVRVYYRADLPVTLPDGSTGTYRVVVASLLGMGRLQAATATGDAIRLWRPRYVILIGIAGGIAARGVGLGDILVSDQIVDYELQKLTSAGPEMRWEVHRADPRLLGAARNFRDEGRQKLMKINRPDWGEPKRHIGPIASGDKVIAFGEVLARYRDTWPKLIGVEMEAAGAATAAFQTADPPGFFVVRGVSDFADEDKGSDEVEKWRLYACDVAASYAIALLKSGSVLPRVQQSVKSTETVQPSPSGRSNPFIYGPPVRPDGFVDREGELRTIFNRLRNGESTAVVGEPHIGKTSLLLKLADEKTQQAYLSDDAKSLLFSAMDLHSIGNDYTPADFWAEALETLGRQPSDASTAHWQQAVKASYARRPLQRLFNHLGSEGRRVVLLLDEFERLLIHPNFQDLAFFALLRSLATFTDGLAVVIASRLSVAEMNERGRGLLDIGSPFFNIMIDVWLGPFDKRAVDRLLDRAGDALSSDDRLWTRRVAGCHPFLLQAMAAALVEVRGQDRQVRAAERFHDRISFHFDDLWHSLDDRTRTAAVILSLVELGCRALGQGFAYGEIEQIDAFGPELRKLAARGLAERVEEGWQFDRERLPLWRGKRWTVGVQAFAWWVRDVVVAESRRVPAYDEWLANKRYRFLLTQEQWDRLVGTVRSAPEWAARGVGALARSLFEELGRSKEQ